MHLGFAGPDCVAHLAIGLGTPALGDALQSLMAADRHSVAHRLSFHHANFIGHVRAEALAEELKVAGFSDDAAAILSLLDKPLQEALYIVIQPSTRNTGQQG
jgi:hypothetical protein